MVALANLDQFIQIIRSSKTRDEARIKLLGFDFTRAQVERFGIKVRREDRLVSGRYSLSDAQVNAILELRLYQLTGLEIAKVEAEYRELLKRIEDLVRKAQSITSVRAKPYAGDINIIDLDGENSPTQRS